MKCHLARLASAAVLAFVSSSVLAADPPKGRTNDTVQIQFQGYDGKFFPLDPKGAPAWVTVDDFAFDAEQTLSIGSQSTGAGAGKITFNAASFTLVPGALDPVFFIRLASGTPFKFVDVYISNNGAMIEMLRFKLAAFKTMAWLTDPASHAVKVKYSIEAGGVVVTFPTPDGRPIVSDGWNRIKNVSDGNPNSIIN
jgi:hypothetical protein